MYLGGSLFEVFGGKLSIIMLHLLINVLMLRTVICGQTQRKEKGKFNNITFIIVIIMPLIDVKT